MKSKSGNGNNVAFVITTLNNSSVLLRTAHSHLQINQMTAWIDGSFIYSSSEAWLNAMRSFQNGSLLTDKSGTMPVKNTMRVPLFNNPVPHVMTMLSPERLYRE